MAFRNPPLTVPGVNTNTGSGAGVEVVQVQRSAINGQAGGAVLFYDGIAGSTPNVIEAGVTYDAGGNVNGRGMLFGQGQGSGATTYAVPGMQLTNDAVYGPMFALTGAQTVKLGGQAAVSANSLALTNNSTSPSLRALTIAGSSTSVGTIYPGTDALGAQPALGPGIAEWTDDVYAHLRYYLQPTGMVLVSGLVIVDTTKGTPTALICTHGGAYAPLHPTGKGLQHVLSGAVSDTPRLFDVHSDGLYLRGTLPTNGQWVAVSGQYPSANRTG